MFTVKALPDTWAGEEEFLKAVATYRNYRLFALQSAPDSFASTFEQEIQFPPESWALRLRNETAVHFVATPHGQDDPWVGMVVVIRPSLGDTAHPADYNLSKRGYSGTVVDHTRPTNDDLRKSSSRVSSPDLSTSLYHINALFVNPSERGKRLAHSLIQECLKFIQNNSLNRGFASAKVGILVDSWNAHAIKLYSGFGFKSMGSNDYVVGSSSRNATTMELDMNFENTDDE